MKTTARSKFIADSFKTVAGVILASTIVPQVINGCTGKLRI